MNDRHSRSNRDWTLLLGAALVLIGIVAIVALVAFTIRQLNPETPVVVQPPTQAPATLVPAPTQVPATLPQPQVGVTEAAPPPAATEPAPAEPTPELPSPTLEPTDEPPTETPQAEPILVAGDQGVNVRRGPGTYYDRVSFLNPGAEAPVTGRFGEWWQIEISAGLGWVFGGIVTPYNVENVPQVQPPPAPTAPPATATPIPAATATPEPADDFRGLVINSYYVEGAPGPFGVNQPIWFNWDISAPPGDFPYNALGTWAQETNQFQKSWSLETYIPPTWRDHIDIPGAGTYHLYLRICFSDGVCVNLAGPVTVVVQ